MTSTRFAVFTSEFFNNVIRNTISPCTIWTIIPPSDPIFIFDGIIHNDNCICMRETLTIYNVPVCDWIIVSSINKAIVIY